MSMRHGRRGMSLVEVIVVIAIMLGLVVVLVPSTRSLFELNQRNAARKLAVHFERFHDEAVMRNRSFRFTYYLDENRYVIEAGEAGALISAGPEEREQYEAEVAGKLKLMDEEQRRAWMHSNRQPFELLEVAGKMEVELPSGVRLGGVYTPQYGRVIKPGDELEGPKGREDEDEPLKVYSYIMNSGLAEHTIIWLVDSKDPTDGWTVEVEPLSGIVRLHGELIEPDKEFSFIPDTPPSLPN
jgi:prepilin-type N-terminal cleavage/methylation domain-containing protein